LLIFDNPALNNRNAKYFLSISLLAFAIVFICDLFGLIDVALPAIFFRLALAASLVTLLIYYNQFSKRTQISNVTQLLTDILKYGLIAYTGAITPDILYLVLSESWFVKIGPFIRALELASFYGIMAYFLYAFTFLKKLQFVKANENVLKLWNILTWVLGLSAISIVLQGQILTLLSYMLLFSGCIILLGLLFRLKWIALINQKTRGQCLVLLALILLTSLVLVQKLYLINLPNLIAKPITLNAFLILVTFAVAAYSIISFLGITFNLPIMSVMEERGTEVKSFQQISRSVLNKDDPFRTFNILFKNCFRSSNADVGALIYFDSEGKKEVVNPVAEEASIKQLDQSMGLISMIEREPEKNSFYIPNLTKKGIMKQGSFAYNSMLMFPVLNKQENLRGIIVLLRTMASGFDDYAIKLVKSYIEQAQVSFEMADLEEENIQSIRVREELNLARKVQMDLIPTENPITEHFELSGWSQAAQEVGGDYYDFTYDNDSLDIIIGDVAGSGSAAAFYMAELRGIFQAMIHLNLPMKEFMEVTNQAVSKSLKRALFTAVTVIEIDLEALKLRYCRAGHTPILYYDSMLQKARYFEDKGMGLGIVRDRSFSDHIHIYERNLQSGDIIVLFTDGITENKNANGELYGQKRLLNQLESAQEHSADTIKNAIIMDCERFGNTEEINDDTTLVVVKIK